MPAVVGSASFLISSVAYKLFSAIDPRLFEGNIGANIKVFQGFGVKLIHNVCSTISLFRNTAISAFIDPIIDNIKETFKRIKK